MLVPLAGTNIQIISCKHDHSLHRKWHENIVLSYEGKTLIGGNNQTIVKESNGKKWRTSEPAIFYFDHRYWFNIVIIFDSNDYYYYCNMSSPFTYKNGVIYYIDYDIDVIIQSDHSYKIIDREEYEVNKVNFNYPPYVQSNIEKHLITLQEWIMRKQDPFNNSFIRNWRELFLNNDKL